MVVPSLQSSTPHQLFSASFDYEGIAIACVSAVSASWGKGPCKGDVREDAEGRVSPCSAVLAYLNRHQPAWALALTGWLMLISLKPAVSRSGNNASLCRVGRIKHYLHNRRDPPSLCHAKRREDRAVWTASGMRRGSALPRHLEYHLCGSPVGEINWNKCLHSLLD